jgi:CheY-like chemotaxis protein
VAHRYYSNYQLLDFGSESLSRGSVMSMTIRSVLILDDEVGHADLLIHLLKPRLEAKFVHTRFPTKAVQLAKNHCFDMVLLDVTLDYNGTQFGGLEVYKELVTRYGAASLLAYSHYITDDLLKRYGLPFNFIEQDEHALSWADKLAATILDLRSKQSCFVSMPFGASGRELYSVIKKCVEAAGYRCVRVDEQAFTKSILDKIFEEITGAKIMIFVATGQNPNVFYEAGYAVAQSKEVITITNEFENLPFNVRARNALRHGTDLGLLEAPLITKLVSLTEVPDA